MNDQEMDKFLKPFKQKSATSEQEPDVSTEPEVSFRIVVPKGGDPYIVTGPGHGNPYGPHGVITPRTAGGQPANDPDVLVKTQAQQMKTPVELPEGDAISDVNMGPATKGIGVTTIKQLRDQSDNRGQVGAGASERPVGAGVTGNTSDKDSSSASQAE